MTALLDRLGPGSRTGDHLLALPAHVDVMTLARAWFPDADWLVEPVSLDTATSRDVPLRGARFRGMAAQPEATPGTLRLAPGHVLTGPHPLTAEDTVTYVLPPRHVEGYVVRPTGDGTPEEQEREAARVLAWVAAAARHAHGAVLESGRTQAVVPDAGQSVDRTLYSAHPLPPQHALALVRTVLVQAVVTAQSAPTDGGPVAWTITTQTPYDGTVEVGLSRTDALPPVLLQLPWRDSGPFAYAVRWRSGSPEDEASDHPSSLHVVARSRIAPVVEKVAAVFERAVAGTVLDDAGFAVGV